MRAVLAMFCVLLPVCGLLPLSGGPPPAAAAADALPRSHPDRFYYAADWTDLTPREQILLARLGWHEDNWTAERVADMPETEFTLWGGLTAEQRAAAAELGYTGSLWDETRPRRPHRDVDSFWHDQDWDDLRPAERHLFTLLGWSAERWAGTVAPPAPASMAWAALSPNQQAAARQLGYDEVTWPRR